MPLCWIFFLKRRRALSKVSFSPTRTSANPRSPPTGETVPETTARLPGVRSTRRSVEAHGRRAKGARSVSGERERPDYDGERSARGVVARTDAALFRATRMALSPRALGRGLSATQGCVSARGGSTASQSAAIYAPRTHLRPI